MNQSLDVYRDWLGITDGPRPPDHYTLLGVPRGESDFDRINTAADARLKIVRPRCLKFPEQGTQLLNEIALARICLTDDEERAAYDGELLTTSTQDVQQWAKLHATFDSFGGESDAPAAVAELAAEIASYAPPKAMEPETYTVRDAVTPEPTSSSDADSVPIAAPSSKKTRWCPHCGSKLLPAATFCYNCSLAEVSSLHRMQLKCRACDKRQPTGMVVCRKCKHDHALRGPQPKMRKSLRETAPYYVADLQSDTSEAEENDPIDLADINPNLTDEDFATALKDEVGDQSEKPIHIKSRTRELTEKKAQREALKKVEEETALANRPFLISLCAELLVFSQHNPLFMQAAVGVAILALFCTPFFFLQSRARTVASAPSPVMMPQQPRLAQVATESSSQSNPSRKPDQAESTLASTSAKTSAPIDPGVERIFEGARAALANHSLDSKMLLDHQEKLMARVADGPDRFRFENLANQLSKEAARRAASEHRTAIGLANDDDDFRQIWEQISKAPAGRSPRSRSDEQLQEHLADTWYQFRTAQVRTRIDGLFDLEQLEEAFLLRDAPLPPELQPNYTERWTKHINSVLETKLNAYIRSIETKVNSLISTQQITSALELLEETASQHSNPPAQFTQFVQKGRETLLARISQLHIRRTLEQGDFVQAQALVEILLQDPTHVVSAKKYQQEMIKLKKWAGAIPAPAVGKNVVRKNVKDPPGDYQSDKLIAQARLIDSADQKRFNEWYRKLGARHNQHRAGYFVLIKDNQQMIVKGLADAAYEAFRLDVLPALGEKKTPVKSDWFGTLEEARQAFPDASELNQSSVGEFERRR